MRKTLKVIFSFVVLNTSLFISSLIWANLPYFPVELPRDNVAHFENTPYPVSTMSEWWYYNGKLISKMGRKFGFYMSYNYTQLILDGKKVKLPDFQIQITDVQSQKVQGVHLYFDEKNAYFSTKDFNIVLDKNITLRNNGDKHVATGIVKTTQGSTLEFYLEFLPARSALLINKTGLVDMWDNTNSYYYSYTHLKTAGYIKINNEKFEIDSEKSLSWMDHQWGDFIIGPFNKWMWSSIQLENGIELVLAVIMEKGTYKPMTKWANIIMPDDTRILLNKFQDFDYIDQGVPPGERHPHIYDLSIPSINLNLHMKAVALGQDINGIWEGLSDVQGTYNGQPVLGQATTENSLTY